MGIGLGLVKDPVKISPVYNSNSSWNHYGRIDRQSFDTIPIQHLHVFHGFELNINKFESNSYPPT